MRSYISLTAVIIIGLLILTACQKTTPPVKIEAVKTNSAPNHNQQDAAPRIFLADAKKDFDAGNVVFIDTRGEASFKQEHIKGALNMPMEMVEARHKEIPTDKKIIAYCS